MPEGSSFLSSADLIRIFVILTGFHFLVRLVVSLFAGTWPMYLYGVLFVSPILCPWRARCLCEARLHMSKVLAISFVVYYMLFAAILYGKYLCLCCYSSGPLHRKMLRFFVFNVVMHWNYCNGLWLSLRCFSVVMIYFSFFCFCYVLAGTKQAG
jgi:hypothetical protein